MRLGMMVATKPGEFHSGTITGHSGRVVLLFGVLVPALNRPKPTRVGFEGAHVGFTKVSSLQCWGCLLSWRERLLHR